ncbi:TlpA family protein disulfide reductase [Hymenobacter aerilatus]|uniref:TlpA family protein disulfide reductase n=1 Tax=Hymenobacter aerilatus TaxID=2932251 RepID=A0A8T9SXG4_9BACT|nr:TlpA disulfide reductase family protein [Hymenobacter aerilatus]UOR06778.1 TlpA family protein disulfide reductase [Hymenobacter aerilatus]
MKSCSLLALALLLSGSAGYAQSICFENYQEKIVAPSRKAMETAKTDKERDSLRFVPADELKRVVGCAMPDFTAQDIQGSPISKRTLKGKVVVMNFWFIGCKPCLAELPALNDLVDQHKGQEVVFIAFGRDSKQRIVDDFLPKQSFQFQHVADSKGYADTFLASVSGFPLTLVFDQRGVLQYVHSGGYIDERAKTAIYQQVSPVIARLLQ